MEGRREERRREVVEWGVKGDENRVCLLGAVEKEGERKGEKGQRRAIATGGTSGRSVNSV